MKSSAKLLAFALIAALMVSLMSFGSFAADTNLAVNGDASQGFDGWVTWSNAESTVYDIVPGGGPDGSDCFHIKNSDAAASTMFQAGVFEPGHSYMIIADAKWTDCDPVVCVGSDMKSGDNNIIGGGTSTMLSGSSDWTTIAFVVTAPEDADPAQSNFGPRIWGGVGEAWFDNIRCYDVDGGAVAAELYSGNIAGDSWGAVDGKWGGPEQEGDNQDADGKKVYASHSDVDGVLTVSANSVSGYHVVGNFIGVSDVLQPNTAYRVSVTARFNTGNEESGRSSDIKLFSNANIAGTAPTVIPASADFATYTYDFVTGSSVDGAYIVCGPSDGTGMWGDVNAAFCIEIKNVTLTNLADDATADQPAGEDQPAGGEDQPADSGNTGAAQTFDGLVAVSVIAALSAAGVVVSKKRK